MEPATQKWTFSSQTERSIASKTLKDHYDVHLNAETIRKFSFDIRPPQDVDLLGVVNFENPCFRPETSMGQIRQKTNVSKNKSGQF